MRTRLTATPALRPGPRDTPLRGVLLTDAEADHVMGLAVLRGAAGLRVYAAPPVRAALAPARGALDRHAPWEWYDSLADGGFVLGGGLVVTAHPMGAKAPKYMPAPAPDGRWVTAYRGPGHRGSAGVRALRGRLGRDAGRTVRDGRLRAAGRHLLRGLTSTTRTHCPTPPPRPARRWPAWKSSRTGPS
ncbi:MBL fold metallo-hydrolase [Streptomyces sp. NPDC020298]|uniref:MBL fold metallo-hydrolase n=1 Tax=Streptomyces sp. NPDC020298 TaxID=3155010 RepID=UPI0033DB037E